MSPHSKKILIIEDDDSLATILRNQLEGAGFAVVAVHDGEEGLKKISSEKPDLILLDIVLPKKDGISMIEELRITHPENKTPIVILSNSDDMNHVSSAIKLNVVTYLFKTDQDLNHIVEAVKKELHIS